MIYTRSDVLPALPDKEVLGINSNLILIWKRKRESRPTLLTYEPLKPSTPHGGNCRFWELCIRADDSITTAFTFTERLGRSLEALNRRYVFFNGVMCVLLDLLLSLTLLPLSSAIHF
jgi:hypothetical protein